MNDKEIEALLKTKKFSMKDMEKFGKETAESVMIATSRQYEKRMDKMLEPRRKQIEKEKQEFFKKFDDKAENLFANVQKEVEILRVTNDAELQTLERMEKAVETMGNLREVIAKAADSMTTLTKLLERQAYKTTSPVV